MTPQHHFLRVGQVVPTDQEVATVEATTLVSEALAMMARCGFDQMPVTSSDVVVGVFSYRSLALNLGIVRRQDSPLSYPVGDFLEDLTFVRSGSEVEDALEAIHHKGAVLVGDEERLLAVVTTADISSYLWTATRQFMIVRDVELATRYLARRACATEDELIALVAAARPAGVEGTPAERLEDLTFGELISVINGPERFGRVFSRTFGSSRELVFSMLEPVRDVRNKVFHFRDAVTPDEVDLVMNARVWLQRRVRMLQ
ncbi:CBS domain-containing protein [Micromonospora sp. WMMD1155]|uniref:CBS domain-containing protein n=1 Tax=Micromonospora sp. WMMD1155 TaxID=3016094 RepID=UPI00249AA03D|nr:CBS domain-containing protein [Micromonospora sp. WMMD1155]WFE51222.1 CBS domain-containing protein [Micromonospora sp. WMMD1155]